MNITFEFQRGPLPACAREEISLLFFFSILVSPRDVCNNILRLVRARGGRGEAFLFAPSADEALSRRGVRRDVWPRRLGGGAEEGFATVQYGRGRGGNQLRRAAHSSSPRVNTSTAAALSARTCCTASTGRCTYVQREPGKSVRRINGEGGGERAFDIGATSGVLFTRVLQGNDYLTLLNFVSTEKKRKKKASNIFFFFRLLYNTVVVVTTLSSPPPLRGFTSAAKAFCAFALQSVSSLNLLQFCDSITRSIISSVHIHLLRHVHQHAVTG